MDYLSVIGISDKCSNWQTIISKADQIFFRSGKNSRIVSVKCAGQLPNTSDDELND